MKDLVFIFKSVNGCTLSMPMNIYPLLNMAAHLSAPPLLTCFCHRHASQQLYQFVIFQAFSTVQVQKNSLSQPLMSIAPTPGHYLLTVFLPLLLVVRFWCCIICNNFLVCSIFHVLFLLIYTFSCNVGLQSRFDPFGYLNW